MFFGWNKVIINHFEFDLVIPLNLKHEFRQSMARQTHVPISPYFVKLT